MPAPPPPIQPKAETPATLPQLAPIKSGPADQSEGPVPRQPEAPAAFDAPLSEPVTPPAEEKPAGDSLVVSAREEPADGSGKNDIPPEFPQKGKHQRNRRNVIIGLVLLFLLVTTGGIFVFVTQKQQVADLRSRAYVFEGLYPKDCGNSYISDCDPKFDYICGGGGTNPIPGDNNTVCGAGKECSSKTGCPNWNGERGCESGYYPCANNNCCKIGSGGGGGGGGGGGETPVVPPETPPVTPTDTPINTPTSTPTNTPTPTPTNTPTSTPGPTSTPTPTGITDIACNATCTTNSECSGSYVCVDSRCRNSSCPEKPSCSCDIALVTTSCNSACTVNTDCSGSLVCLNNLCRNASCAEASSCLCGGATSAAPTPKVPVSGTGPSVLGASIIAGGFLLILLGLLF